MTNVFGLSKRKNGVAMNCDRGEMEGASFGGKMMSMAFCNSSLECLLDILLRDVG